jgi:hypothetical protein
MLLQCGTDGGGSEGARLAASWLRPETLESLVELNELCLALLAEQGAVPAAAAPALLREVAAQWRTLDGAARRRAAGCPYLLIDGGFADAERWRQAALPQVGDAGQGGYAAFFTVPATVGVGRLVFTYAWHLARTQGAAARLLLGMPPACAALIGSCTLRQIHALAERHPEWLRPRWPSRPEVWRELLAAAGSGEARVLERARLHGLTLLAGEARLAAHARVTRLSATAGTMSGMMPSRP